MNPRLDERSKRRTGDSVATPRGSPDLTRSVARLLADTFSAPQPTPLVAIAERLASPRLDLPVGTLARCLLSALAQALEVDGDLPPDRFLQNAAQLFLHRCAEAAREAT